MQIAIVGISFNLPESTGFDSLSNIINNGIDVSKECKTVQKDIIPKYFDLKGIKEFDSNFFGYSDFEVINMDPQHRQLLYLSWKALDEYGFLGESEKEGLNFGVYTSVSNSDYLIKNILLNDKELSYSTYINNIPDTAATKIAYKFNLKGESININTACSSGLVALKKAADSLINKEVNCALVGGSKIITDIENGYEYIEGGIFSKTGKCSPFSIDSSGIIPGVGSIVLVLKRLEDAKENKDEILAVIKGINTNNDGNDKVSFTAPSIKGQENAISGAYEKFNIKLDEVDYIETHGTGTAIGDAIEIRALSNVFKETKKNIYIGSIKANFGHLDTTSGLLGVLKAITMIRNQVIPKQANYVTSNPLLDIENSNFRISTEIFSKEIKNIGVSSFGVGGTNVHAIISKYEDYSNEDIHHCRRKDFIFPISYRDDESYIDDVLNILNEYNINEKLSAIRMLTYEKFINSNVRWFSYSTDNDKLEKIPEEISIDYDIDNIRKDNKILKRFKKIPLMAEKLSTKELWHDITLKEKEVANDKGANVNILNLISKYVNKPINDVGEMFLTEIDVDSILLVELISILKKDFNLDINISDFSQKIKVNDLINKTNNMSEEVEYNKYESVEKEIKQILDLTREDDKRELLLGITLRDLEKNTGFSVNLKDYIASKLSLKKYIEEKKMGISYSKSKNFIYLKSYDEMKENLFVIHPAGGTVYGYNKIFTNKFYKYNVILISFPFDYYEEIKFFNLETLASYYLEVIKLVNGNKKFNLCGYSFGGNVAYEICRQLNEDSLKVNTLVMIDSYPMESYYNTSYAEISDKAVSIMTKELELNNLISDEDIKAMEKVWKLNHMMLKRHFDESRINVENSCLLICKEKENQEVLESLAIKDINKNIWCERFINNLDTYNINGNHYSVFSNKKYAAELGEIINKYLNQYL
ncbi:beta-ketoacyl synthase N-terminal-like domain-containing protein [Clostridium paraputrificum]|uniref:beta-ketoacyl synthase N-terminal-like domain-containing protein n=1 Tax=Clostridium paraputrificum TaxID=29363 RepID=UPI003D3424CD